MAFTRSFSGMGLSYIIKVRVVMCSRSPWKIKDVYVYLYSLDRGFVPAGELDQSDRPLGQLEFSLHRRCTQGDQRFVRVDRAV